MNKKQLADYIADESKKEFGESNLTELVVVEPNFADFVRWQTTAMSIGDDATRSFDSVWVAVDAVVRMPSGVKQWMSQSDFDKGPARLYMAVGLAANNFLLEYAREDIEKKVE